ncbi:hypothetical protein [Caulobacter mirabilis]|uniref:Uncharacterized protein n=1 Tax=Caulobacter mirabilis TaxID=69666 RepID=A0A2D2AT74_9CAUL|nr:hypothetical protein [Caulobacter mirabilis]ATQ41165.1 hypothetical protein CSW64_01430 [Caulobacter mirabilis]
MSRSLPAYGLLDANEIVVTVERLRARIEERFPASSLTKAAAQLGRTARDTAHRARALSRPYYGLRTLTLLLAAAGVVGLGLILKEVDWAGILARTNEEALTALLESAVNLALLIAGGLWFLLTLEERWKRARIQADLHQLRAFAHVVDMHQLTKDPTVLLGGGQRTASSPERRMSRFELTRYLEYCAEMLALTGKLSALYAGETNDHVVVAAASDVETLCTDLGRKIWQKITILGDLAESPAA